MRYNFYIDIDDGEGFVQITPKNIEPFKITRDEGYYFYRMGWGKIQIVDDPVMYELTGESKYGIFSILQRQYYNKEIRVLITTPTLITKFPAFNFDGELLPPADIAAGGIMGYFSHSDCTFDFDRKIVEVVPTILDKYTNLIENWEKEISFDEYIRMGTPLTLKMENANLTTFQIAPYKTVFPSGSYQWNIFAEAITNDKLKDWVDEASNFGSTYNQIYGINAYFSQTYGYPKRDIFEDNAGKDPWGLFNHGGTSMFDLVDYYEPLGSDQTAGDWELCEVTVYYGVYVSGGLLNKSKRDIWVRATMKREEKIIKNDNGVPVPPETGTWNNRGLTADGLSTLWTRKPYNGNYGALDATGSWQLGDVEYINTGTFDNPSFKEQVDQQTGKSFYGSLTSKVQYPEGDTSKEIDVTFGLREFTEYIINNTHTDFATSDLISTFFFNDDETSMKVLENRSGMNYVTLADNYLNDIRLFFKRDLRTDIDEDGDSVVPSNKVVEALATTTFKDFFENLNRLFGNSLIWWLDDNQDIHLEHLMYVDTVLRGFPNNFIDIAEDAVNIPLLDYTRKWSYDKAQLWSFMEFNMIDAGYVDFTKNTMEFPKIVSNKRGKDVKKDFTIHYISTDVRYALENPNDLEEGVILVVQNISNEMMNKIGQVSDQVESNGYLALSNLLCDFATYENVYVDGFINEEEKAFMNTSRTKVGVEFTVKGTQIALFYNTYSEALDVGMGTGIIDEGMVDFVKEYTRLKLRYRYISESLSDRWVLVIQRSDQIEFVGAQDIWHDIDNYEL